MSPARPMLAALLAVVLALLCALVPFAPAGGAPARRAQPAVAAGCTTGSLVIWLTGASGTAGTTFTDLEFTNLGSTACSLVGYPGVSAVTLSGTQLGRAARRNAVVEVAIHTIAPDKTLSALLGIGEAANYPAASCKPIEAAGLRVYPPNQTRSKVVPFPFEVCSGTTPSVLSVGAVEANAPVPTSFG